MIKNRQKIGLKSREINQLVLNKRTNMDTFIDVAHLTMDNLYASCFPNNLGRVLITLNYNNQFFCRFNCKTAITFREVAVEQIQIFILKPLSM